MRGQTYGQCSHTGGTVYVIGSLEFHEVKIGYTASLDTSSRLAELQVGCPYQLYPVAVFAGCRHVEHGLHEMFTHLRVRGEWFLFRRGKLPMHREDVVVKIAAAIKRVRTELEQDDRRCARLEAA